MIHACTLKKRNVTSLPNCIVAVCLVAFLCLWGTSIAQAQTVPEPPVEIPFRVYEVKDWGTRIAFQLPKLIEGFPSIARVRIHNPTNELWTDLNPEVSDDGVSVTEFTSKDVPPGGTFDFEFSVTPSADRKLQKKISIHSGPNGQATKKPLLSLDITGFISPAASVTPTSFTLREFEEGKARIKILTADQKKVKLLWDEIKLAKSDASLQFENDVKLEGMLVHSVKLLPSNAAILEGKQDVILELEVPFVMLGKSEKYTCKTEITLRAESPVRITPGVVQVDSLKELEGTQSKTIEFAISDQRDIDATARPLSVRFAKGDAGGIEKEIPLPEVKIIYQKNRFRHGSVSIPVELLGGNGAEAVHGRLIILEETSPSTFEPLGSISLTTKSKRSR